VVHHQVASDAIQPGPERDASKAVAGQAVHHTREYLAGQILGQALIVHPCSHVPKDSLVVSVVEFANSVHIASLDAFYQACITRIEHVPSSYW
jgi:hypothetical protein